MMKQRLLTSLFISFFLSSLLFGQKEKEPIVLISTNYGDIKIKLYNETPKHRDNFIKLAKDGFYDGTLFHRVIRDFMIQGGDPESKNALAGAKLGNGSPGYTLPAEITSKYFHKRGALAAARLGDNINPNRESSGSQFYIVQGRKFTEEDLKMQANSMNQSGKQLLYREFFVRPENSAYSSRLQELQRNKDQEGIKALYEEIGPIIDAEFDKQKFSFNEEQIKAYTTLGGAPHLDGTYTVFGEVIEGMDVVDKIASAEVDQMTRPLEDVKITVKVIK